MYTGHSAIYLKPFAAWCRRETSPVGKQDVNDWTSCTFFTAVGRLEAVQWAGRTAFNIVTLIFQSRGHTSTYPKLQLENIQKASELLL